MEDAVIDVRRGVLLDGSNDIQFLINQDCIRVRAAYINTKLIHAQQPPLQRSSRGI